MRWFKPGFMLSACLATILISATRAQDAPLDAAKQAFEYGDYKKTIAILEPAAARDSNNGDIQLLLTKAYLETNQTDAAVKSAEKAVAINPNKSEYHNWLGQAYGEKASHASMFTAYSLARKTQKEFETAVKLDDRNFDAAQNLIEYDCTAPSIVGGGEDKAQPLIQKLLSLDAAQGHYAQGNCRMQKKDVDGVDAEFTKALASKPKSLDQIREMVVFFAGRGEGDKVLLGADAAAALAPSDPRVGFFRGVGWILKGQNPADAEKNLHQYLNLTSPRSDYPSLSSAHYWMGRLHESQKNPSAARTEYEVALKLDPNYKNAQEALKKLGGG
jgi:tetratricopeptide (TPR) repeat protein